MFDDSELVKKAYAKQAYEKVTSQIIASKGGDDELDVMQSSLFEDLLHERAWDFEKFRKASPQPDTLLPHKEL